MEVAQTQPQSGPAADRAPIVNDFSITVATVNGSGSQTANNTLIRAIHKMGIPASGKNLFPSNIQGLPTWFTIRVSKDGYLARRERAEILVAMNKATIAEDIQKLESGGICLYPIDEPLPVKRDDVTFYPMPVNELTRKSGADAKLRPYVANMVFVGILACLLDIEMSEIEAALSFHFGGKKKAVDLNMNVVKAGVRMVGGQPHQDRSLPRGAHEQDRRHVLDRRQHGRRPWARSSAACNSWRGIPSRRPLRWPMA